MQNHFRFATKRSTRVALFPATFSVFFVFRSTGNLFKDLKMDLLANQSNGTKNVQFPWLKAVIPSRLKVDVIKVLAALRKVPVGELVDLKFPDARLALETEGSTFVPVDQTSDLKFATADAVVEWIRSKKQQQQ